MKKSAIALVICVALNSAPQAKAACNPVWALPIYAFYLLNTVYMNDPVAEPVFKGSFKTVLKPQFSSKQWWRNLKDLHDEWMAGQCYKERLVKVNKDLELKVSRKKCPATGFTGKGLSYLSCITKTRKALVDVALIYFVIAALKNGNNKHVIKRFLNWDNELCL